MRLKSSIIVLSLFASSSLFANCAAWGTMAVDPTFGSHGVEVCNGEVYQFDTPYAPAGWTNYLCQTPTNNKHQRKVYIRKLGGPFVGAAGNYYTMNDCFTTYYYVNVSSCSAGYFPNADNVCALPDLTLYNGDRVGCMEHGGWTIEGKCVTESVFQTTIKQNKTGYKVGTGLKIGGILMTAAGIIGFPFTFGASAGLIGVGVHSYLAGASAALYFGANGTPYYSDNAGSIAGAGSALSTGGKTYKLDLLNYEPSAPSTPPDPSKPSGQVVTKTDEATGRVEGTTYVPAPVTNAMADPSKVDFVNNNRTEPLDMTGVIESTYDYPNKSVTTKTYISPTEIKTEISPITITQNPDGSISAIPPPSSSAPTVSGSSGGDWTDTEFLNKISANYDATTAYHEALVDCISDPSKCPADINTTKVTDQAQHNSDIISKLDEIKQVLSAGSAPDLSDGSEGFGDHDTQIKEAYSGFIYTDPLGLNALGGGTIPSYGFTLYGRHFVVLDQAMFDYLPLDAIRNLFLFVAAILAFITVISGV